MYTYIYIHSVFFLLHNSPLLIPLYNTAVLINICRGLGLGFWTSGRDRGHLVPVVF